MAETEKDSDLRNATQNWSKQYNTKKNSCQARVKTTSGVFSFKVFLRFMGKVGNRSSLLPRICGVRKSKISEN